MSPMQRHFHEELERLKQTVLAMGALVERMGDQAEASPTIRRTSPRW